MKYSEFTTDGDTLELEIFVKGLGLRSLHYGLWQKGLPVTIDGVSTAQKYYTKKLIGMFPKNAETVLDVGAGIGDNAVYMAEKGMNVNCVSPSPSQQRFFEENIIPEFPGVEFVRSRYKDLVIEGAYDVVLMSKSSNYFPMEIGASQNLFPHFFQKS